MVYRPFDQKMSRNHQQLRSAAGSNRGPRQVTKVNNLFQELVRVPSCADASPLRGGARLQGLAALHA